MKKIILTLLAMFVCVGFANAYSITSPNYDTSGYAYTSADYWVWADFAAPNTSLTSEFDIKFEGASYNSSFGLFTVDDYTNPTLLGTQFKIFEPADEPGADATVSVKVDSGVYSITLDPVNGSEAWTVFDRVFGFYFGVADSGETFYTDQQFNTVDESLEHVATYYSDGQSKVLVLLDDQNGGGDRDFNDMIIKATDVSPVPEPGTLLLLGSGLIGLAFLKRRKQA